MLCPQVCFVIGLAALALCAEEKEEAAKVEAVVEKEAEEPVKEKRGLEGLSLGYPLDTSLLTPYASLFAPKLHATPLFLGARALPLAYSSLPLSAFLPPTTITVHNKYAVPVAKPYAVPVDRPVPVAVPHPVPVHFDKPYAVPVAKPYNVYVDKPVAVAVDRPYALPVKHAVPVPVFKDIPVFKPFPVPVAQPVEVPVADWEPLIATKSLDVTIDKSH